MAVTLAAATLGLLGASAAMARTAYVSNAETDGVTSINLANNTASTKLIKVEGPTSSIAITPNGEFAYVPSFGFDSLTQINLATGVVAKPFALVPADENPPAISELKPEALAITPNGKFVYVAVEEANDVVAVEVATNKVVATIPVGCEPEAVAITPNGETAYVANKYGSTKCTVASGEPAGVTPIELATNKAEKTIPVGAEPEKIAISPNGKTAYVANGASGTVSEIEVATNKVVATITVGLTENSEKEPVSKEPSWISITPNGETAYVSNTETGSVTPINLATNAVGTPIKVGSTVQSTPRAMAITPSGKTLYVALETAVNEEIGPKEHKVEGDVTPIEIATNKAETPIKIPLEGELTKSEPDGIAIVPDQGPTAAFSATTAQAGSATSFNGGSSSDLEGKVASYAWNFGDGASATTSSPTTSHVYATAGAYTVTLTVTDEEGCSTALLFTGQMAYCDSDSGAQVSDTITVPSTGPGTKTKVGAVPGVARAASSAIVKHGKAQVKLTCTGKGACKGSLKLVASAKGHGKHAGNVVIGKDSFSIAKGKNKTVKVPLSAKGISLLGKAGKHGLKVTVKGHGIKTGKLLLKEASHSHKHGGKAKQAKGSVFFARLAALAAPFGA